MINWDAIFNLELAVKAFPSVIQGLPYTIGLSLVGFILGAIVAATTHSKKILHSQSQSAFPVC